MVTLLPEAIKAVYNKLTSDSGVTGATQKSWMVTLYDPATVEDNGVYDSAPDGQGTPTIVFGNCSEKKLWLQGSPAQHTIHITLLITSANPDLFAALGVLKELDRVLVDEPLDVAGHSVDDKDLALTEVKRMSRLEWFIECNLVLIIQ